MDSAKVNDWLQVVGLFGVIASLVFVGLQMKQDREIALATIYQARTAAVAETMMATVADKDVVRSLVKEKFNLDPDTPIPAGIPGVPNTAQPLTPMELMARIFADEALWSHWDNSQFQYQQGFLPESHWIRIREQMSNSLRNRPITRWVFELNPENHRSEFQKIVFDIISEIDAEGE